MARIPYADRTRCRQARPLADRIAAERGSVPHLTSQMPLHSAPVRPGGLARLHHGHTPEVQPAKRLRELVIMRVAQRSTTHPTRSTSTRPSRCVKCVSGQADALPNRCKGTAPLFDARARSDGTDARMTQVCRR